MSSAREFDKSKQLPWDWQGAPRGAIFNAPHDDLPQGAIAGVTNAHCFPTEIQPRLASWLYSEIQPPVLLDDDGNERSGYTAYKTGTHIISTGGDIFTEDDVNTWWVWPGDPNHHDFITEYVSATEVICGSSGDREETGGCWMHSKLNMWAFHHAMKKLVYLWGQDIYVADDLELSGWTKARCLSRDKPADAIADSGEMDDFLAFANSGGIFVLQFETTVPTFFKKNVNVPAVLLDSVEYSLLSKYRYCGLYSMSRLSGSGLRDRTSAGVVIEQETGTCDLNLNTDPPRDYGYVWIPKRIGDVEMKGGRLVCEELAAAVDNPVFWAAVNNATFQLTVNGITQNILVNTAGVTTMGDVAEEFEEAVQTIFPYVTVRYENHRIVFTTGEERNATIGYLGDGIGGTNVADDLRGREDDGAVLDNDYSYYQKHNWGVFTIPKNVSDPTKPERHFTHYVFYRQEDDGPDSISVNLLELEKSMADIEKQVPTKFTWCKETRVAGAFYASRDANGLVTVYDERGQFQLEDEGTPLEWEDGEIDTIYLFVDEYHVYTRPASEDLDYYDEEKKLQACAIGGGRVIRITQSGNVVTRHGGAVFTADDEGGILHHSDHTYGYIEQFVDADTVIVGDTITREMSGTTIDPTERVICDNVSDDKLRDRMDQKHVGLLGHRYWTAMPACNILEVVPGFIITALRGYSDIYYCQLGVTTKYLSGYYLSNRQKLDKVEGAIQMIRKMPNKFIVFCDDSTWGGPTNNIQTFELPEFGESYAVLYADIIDKDVGVVDYGSIQAIDFGLLEMRCADNAWRQFDGIEYFDDDYAVDAETGQDIVKKDLKEMYQLGISVYQENIGHIYWGKKK